ncbi:hypothetical protein L486_00163 [Kwoniella mangroviensis CBS 10435]|uniref:Uncharacterized protein n=1 Tax=Kwoniella mangroviensis CBS 10435 TaxID=1331196 RepID=A0A1B9IYD0_9TREE|nr:hypothetical protein L486_00163 [Kwoniella mangroviensis CBS 10435]
MSTSSANSKTPLEDQVLPSERPQALSIVEYHTSHPETYIFIARTTSQKVIIQVRHDDPDDKLGIEGYFTETPELIRHIEQAQEDVWKATVDAGLDKYPGVKTLEQMREWRYDGNNYPKRDEKPPWGDGPAPWERDDEGDIRDD